MKLTAGRLVLPFPRVKPMPTAQAYYLVTPVTRDISSATAASIGWIQQELQGLRRSGR
jgi:hypothetical protein